jgi:hypothetical protein
MKFSTLLFALMVTLASPMQAEKHKDIQQQIIDEAPTAKVGIRATR